MKKSLLITVGLFATLQLHGQSTVDQGSVSFSNIGLSAPVLNSLTFDMAGTPLNAVAGTTFSVGLYFAPYDFSNPVPPDPSTMTQAGASANLVAPGLYNAGLRTFNITTADYFLWFQVKAWETAFGSTYERAEAEGPMNGRTALLGVSNITRVYTGVVPSGTPNTLHGISAILLTVVPEPSVVAFGALSACVLLVFRSRKPVAAQ